MNKYRHLLLCKDCGERVYDCICRLEHSSCPNCGEGIEDCQCEVEQEVELEEDTQLWLGFSNMEQET